MFQSSFLGLEASDIFSHQVSGRFKTCVEYDNYQNLSAFLTVTAAKLSQVVTVGLQRACSGRSPTLQIDSWDRSIL